MRMASTLLVTRSFLSSVPVSTITMTTDFQRRFRRGKLYPDHSISSDVP